MLWPKKFITFTTNLSDVEGPEMQTELKRLYLFSCNVKTFGSRWIVSRFCATRLVRHLQKQNVTKFKVKSKKVLSLQLLKRKQQPSY